MGIYVESGSESEVLNFGGSSVVGRARAAQANIVSDLIELGPDGRSYPVKVSDYSVISDKGSTVIAETSLIAGRSYAYSRYAVLRDELTGNFFFVAPDNAGDPAGNCMVYKISPGGDVLKTVTTGKVGLLYNPFIRKLSNGNIVICWTQSGGSDISFFVVDPDLNIIVGDTIIDADPLTRFFGMEALSGGGFAVCYTKVGNTQNLAIYANDGSVVFGSSSIQSWGATGADIVGTKVAQLSNGNICIACTSDYTTTEGTYIGIFTPSGAEAFAMVNINIVGAASSNPDIAVINGYFAVAYGGSPSSVSVNVYNNAGAIQGASLTIAVPLNAFSLNCFKILADGVNFYLLNQNDPSLNFDIRKINSSGDVLLHGVAGSFTADGAGLKIDAFIKDGLLVAMHNQNTDESERWAYFVTKTDDLFLETQTTPFGAAVTLGGLYGSIIPCDSFVFAAFFDADNPVTSSFYLGKYQDTAIAGVAITAVSAGNILQVSQGIGNHFINDVNGSSPVAFDMTSSAISGNKGTVMKNNVTLQGVV